MEATPVLRDSPPPAGEAKPEEVDAFVANGALEGPDARLPFNTSGGNIAEAYATEKDGEIWLYNSYIPEYHAGSHFNHEPRRARKLLPHRREIDRLIGAVEKQGVTLVPLDIHFNARGIAKVQLGIARGKKKYDKRESEKARDWQRQKQRLLRAKG